MYTRGIALRTFAQMWRALDDLEAIVDRAIARVPKGVSIERLAIVEPPVSGFISPAPAAGGADTS